jgi:hypothetical protein
VGRGVRRREGRRGWSVRRAGGEVSGCKWSREWGDGGCDVLLPSLMVRSSGGL